MEIEYKELTSNEITNNLLSDFKRYQNITDYWKYEDQQWVIKHYGWVVDWNEEEKQQKIQQISNWFANGEGYLFCAFLKGKLVGFTVLLNTKFGSLGQYIQLKYLYVSSEYRGNGIGKQLFELCVKRGRELGAEKLYISSNCSVETVEFYMKRGCRDVMEINKELAELEPNDRPLEFVLIKE